MDEGYDTKGNFEFLASQDIDAGIRVWQGYSPQDEGPRGEAESLFTGFKRLFGEPVQAKKWERMVQEIRLKVWVCNLFIF